MTALLLPLVRGATGAPQNPATDRGDQSGLFGNGYEQTRRYRSTLSATPAHQGFRTDDLTRFENHDRLVLQKEFFPLDCLTQVGFDHEPLECRGVHPRLKENMLTLAARLGNVHRNVRVTHQFIRRFAGHRLRDTHTRAHKDFLATKHERTTQCGRNAVGNLYHIVDDVRVFDKHGEFVSAEPCDHVGVAHTRFEPAGRIDQQSITGSMTQRIVDGLEVVEIEK